MTAMNVVHMRVKTGKEDEFLRIHQEMSLEPMPGARNFWAVNTGGRSYVIVGEWDNLDALVGARPTMIQNLDRLRPLLEDLGGGRGVTEPWSGSIALHRTR